MQGEIYIQEVRKMQMKKKNTIIELPVWLIKLNIRVPFKRQ